MIDAAQSVLQPIIVDLLTYGLVTLIGVVASGLPGFLRRRVEAVDRQAIYNAVDTAATLLMAGVKLHPSVRVPDAAITAAARALTDKMPGVVKRLAPTQQAVEDLIRAAIQRKLDETLGRDRLAEALRQAGVEVPPS